MNIDESLVPTQTVAVLASALAERSPERVTHVFGAQAVTAAAMVSRMNILATALHEMGLRAGDVISFQLPNWEEALVIDLAAALLGLVVVPIVPIYRDAEVGYMLADSRAKAVFVPGQLRGFDHLAMLARLRGQLPDLRHVIAVRAEGADGTAILSFDTLMQVPAVAPGNGPPVAPGSLKLIMYTSGTTGRPKGVMHSHRSMACTVRRSMRHWGQGDGDTMLMASPVTHITGFGSGLELPLLTGVRTVFMDRWDAKEGVRLIEAAGATISMGATPFLQELLAEARRLDRRLPSLRAYACGGASVPQALIEQANAWFAVCRAFRVFGSTETPLATLGFVGAGQQQLSAETDGEAVHYDLRIVDDAGRPVPDGQEGEICARGPGMMLGYLDPQDTAAAIDADGYFHTGDLGWLGEDRALRVTGRKKDLINRGGEKLSAREIEDSLARHPALREVAVVAMPHERLGETACAFVVLNADQAFDGQAMAAWLAQAGLARQKVPERLVIVEQLPMTLSGKVRKDLLRNDIRKRVATEAAAAQVIGHVGKADK